MAGMNWLGTGDSGRIRVRRVDRQCRQRHRFCVFILCLLGMGSILRLPQPCSEAASFFTMDVGEREANAFSRHFLPADWPDQVVCSFQNQSPTMGVVSLDQSCPTLTRVNWPQMLLQPHQGKADAGNESTMSIQCMSPWAWKQKDMLQTRSINSPEPLCVFSLHCAVFCGKNKTKQNEGWSGELNFRCPFEAMELPEKTLG